MESIEKKLDVVPAYKWHPIEPLSDEDRKLDLSELDSLSQSWHDFRTQIDKTNPDNLVEFKTRLIRALSIETGILERIYELDRGTTEALIARGFYEELVSRDSTDIEPAHLIDILRDQYAAIELVQDLIGQFRPLTKGMILELHAILTRHQDTTPAVDHLGRRIEIPLRRGAFKLHPNNPKRPDGGIHEYAPAEQVDSEVERLLGLFQGYANESPILVASWFQHRFTQIHPFQDGNGRVSRAIVTYILMRSDLLPLVIDRDRRTEYLDALQTADLGNLGPLVALYATLEKHALLRALSLDTAKPEVQHRTITQSVIESIAQKRWRQKEQKRNELLQVNHVAAHLRSLTEQVVQATLHQVALEAFEPEEVPSVFVLQGGPDHNTGHWYKYEVTKLNREMNAASRDKEGSEKWINFDEDHYFVKGTIREKETRLIFVVSSHHIGRELTGVMEISAFAQIETYDEASETDHERVNQELIPASMEPFAITWKTDLHQIEDSYKQWLDRALGIALKEWGDRL
ncbi:MAG TPA: Fic family protein [Candidatus Angelobacter sp.]